MSEIANFTEFITISEHAQKPLINYCKLWFLTRNCLSRKLRLSIKLITVIYDIIKFHSNQPFHIINKLVNVPLWSIVTFSLI